MNHVGSSPPASKPARSQGSRPAAGRPRTDVLGVFIVEVGAWLTMLSAAALSFAVAGAYGVTAFLAPDVMADIHTLTGEGGFASRPAVLLYAAVIAAGVAGMFVPQERLSARVSLRVALIAAVVITGLALTQLFTVSAILGVFVGLGVGAALAAVLSLVAGTRVKPWRSAGVAAAVMLFASYAAQLVGGTAGGHEALRWLLLVGSLVMLAGVIVLLTQTTDQGVGLPETGGHVLDRSTARPGTPVTFAWPCHLLFGVLGTVGILAQPSVADLGFGQAGMSVILCAVLLGWAVGFETGPDFAPGMTRTRLTSFSLIAAGVFTVSAGVLAELSGKAVLSGGVAFLVGLGVRSQRYRFSRRIGAVVGMAVATLITAVGFTAEIPLSSVASWNILPADLAYVLIGTVAFIGGVVSLFTFGPTGISGIGVDVIHAFRRPAASGEVAAASATTAAGAFAAGADTPVGAADAAEAPNDSVAGGGAQSLAAALGTTPGAAGSVGPDAPGGLFIAMEGGDGTGKSTQIHLLADALRDQGHGEVVTTREPGGTAAGTLLRSVVLDGDGITPRAEALVFAADRSHHVASLVRPIVERGGIVITDRYIDSSRAYQAAGRDLGDDEIAALSTWATEGMRPDLTIILDANPAVTRQRTTVRGDENHLDALDNDFHSTVRRSFLDYAAAAPDRYVVVDAGHDIDTVAADVLRAVEQRIAQRSAGADPQQHAAGADVQQHASEDPVTVAQPASTGPPHAETSPEHSAVELSDAEHSDAEHSNAEDSVTVAQPTAGLAAAASDDPATELRPAPGAGHTPGARPVADDDEETRVVRRADPTAQQNHPPGPQTPPPPPVVEGSEAPTTVQPAVPSTSGAGRAGFTPSRQTSRERLRAQAEIERQARERLRAQHGHDRRGPDAPGRR
ncbi:dTMP kinase [Brevibacterium jeotgali]|uniref:Thymidylate kinase n=1 Tax=Brevibacterium jeotgali TaxID=1262550 RepID=A0A2H1L1L2_9MICO|nr:dTMP kinase [Brevibacterium jeotgali]TWC02034.1 dTMP kinase [Brevibacterium jeotgali]SMY10615.1 dTMP kinase [Brevibacterium jeotgali]